MSEINKLTRREKEILEEILWEIQDHMVFDEYKQELKKLKKIFKYDNLENIEVYVKEENNEY